ncbi:Zinc finger protein [Drechslerella dactyloides]|uniref:Zinc finger protein n=1 Tax=Drechslerella dactyloides TaxID=74499 RepID=A0AAD6NIE8_DREDA|nr:Zinc finger protein [Drechslerella dactyloides]
MSGPYYGNNSPETFRHDARDRDRRGWGDPRDSSRGRMPSHDLHESSYGRLREDDYTPDGNRRTRSPAGPMPRRRPPRSRSPPNIDRYTPGGGPAGRYAGSGDVYIPGQGPAGGSNGSGSGYGGPPSMGRSEGGSNSDRYMPANIGGGGHGGYNGGGGNAMAPILLDPHGFDYLLPFAYFSEWWSGTPASAPSKAKYANDITMKEKYDTYKDGLNGRVAKLFVKSHKDEEWFRERYVDGEGEEWRSKTLEWRKGQWKIWADELKSGRWDNWLADAKEGVKVNITAQSNGKIDTHMPEKEDGTDEPSEDVLPAVSSGTGALRDDSLDRPALLIKTVSPTVKRANLEKLAMTVQGFQYLSLGDPNPNKKFHRIGWILIDPASVSEGSVEQAAALLNEERIHDEEKGDFVVHVGVHNPPKVLTRKMLHDIMSVPEEIISEVDRVRAVVLKLEQAMNTNMDEDMMLDDNGDLAGYRGWDLILAKVDDIMAKRLAERAANEPEEEPEDGEAEDDLPSDEELERAKRTIDIAVEYLRRVFSFCYYCFTEADSIHELVRRCPGGHIRRPLPANTDGTAKQLHPGSEKWVKNLRDRIALFLTPDSVDTKRLGAQDPETAFNEETNKFIKQEDEGKFRCRVKDCTKLFKSEEFVRKHMTKRHPEFVTGIEQEIRLLNAYVMDPFHITAPKPENGVQGGGHGMGGQGMGMGGLPPRPGGGMDGRNMMSGYPYAAGQYGDPYMAGGLGPTPAGVDRYIPGMGGRPGSPNRNGGVGPQRRRGGMQANVRPSPYPRPGGRDTRDRQEREREREGRFAAAIAAGGGASSGTTPSAGATPGKDDPGAAGRSLKSYMDLDASAGKEGKVEELDY